MTGPATRAAVAIGRNEGARLAACLASLTAQFQRVVYVDSNSNDDSVSVAKGLGVEVVELDQSQPNSAARGRNAGFEALRNEGLPDYVQFIDGDCIMQADWAQTALAAFAQDDGLGIVTGWRSEVDPTRSVYNALCDFEWHRPAGDIPACGGDMMVRSSVFDEINGFDPTVIAAEDDEFCVRLRGAGWRILRLPVEMSLHDANMTRFTEWWQRAVRSGHGFAQVASMHPGYFAPERRRVLVFGAVMPLLAALGAMFAPWIIAILIALYGISYWRTFDGLVRAGLVRSQAAHQAVLLVLSKFPNLQGMIIYGWRRLRGRKIRIIEYK